MEATVDVTAQLSYTLNDGTRPVSGSIVPGGPLVQETGTPDVHAVTIRDGREMRDGFSLDTNGFVFVDHETAVTDFFDPVQLRDVYKPEVVALVKAQTGARRVEVFDHTLRSGDEDERTARQIREPVSLVHNDYTAWSGPQRVRDLFPDEAETLLAGRVAVVQVWRPIAADVVRSPLAICDAASLAADDLIETERRHADRVGEIYRVAYNPAHRWSYFPRMTRNEALVFKCYDSLDDGRARYTAHGSFEDPATPADAPPRESIEVRTLAFW